MSCVDDGVLPLCGMSRYIDKVNSCRRGQSVSHYHTPLAGSTWPTLTLYSDLIFQVCGGARAHTNSRRRDSPPQKGDSALPKSRLDISEKPTRKQPFSLGDSGFCGGSGDSASIPQKGDSAVSEKPTRRFSRGDSRFCASDSMRVCDDNGVAARRRR